MRTQIFFLVILIEIFILKTTMYHKYTLTLQKYKKKVKKRYYRLSLRNPSVIVCHLFFQLTIWL
jgi:hypothetical protein